MISWKDVQFFFITAIYAVTTARLTTGLPLETASNIIDAICLGIAAGIGGCIAFRADPDAAITSIFKRAPKP